LTQVVQPGLTRETDVLYFTIVDPRVDYCRLIGQSGVAGRETGYRLQNAR
jgi:hypothetical protein